MDHDLSKLPLWAQRHISMLEQRLEGTERLLTEVENKDSPITWAEHIGPRAGIPRYAKVRYDLDSGSHLRVYFKDDHISVYTFERLNIQPISANAVDIGVVRENHDPSD